MGHLLCGKVYKVLHIIGERISKWKAWERYPQVTAAFSSISQPSEEIELDVFDKLQRFVILMYDQTCSETDVNVARRYLFTQKNRTLEGIPPTRDALLLHIKRAAYQAGHVWGQANTKQPVIPSPTEWGWEAGTIGWEPKWMTLPEALKSCKEIIACRCTRKICTGHCKCVSSNVQCTSMCKCGGNCEN